MSNVQQVKDLNVNQTFKAEVRKGKTGWEVFDYGRWWSVNGYYKNGVFQIADWRYPNPG